MMRSVLLAVILFLAPLQTLAQGNCVMQRWGTGFATYEHDGEAVTYKLSVDGTRWSTQGYGYHATAAMICESCSNREASWWLVSFHKTWSHRVNVPRRRSLLPFSEELANGLEHKAKDETWIENSGQRAQRKYEQLYYPWVTFQGTDLSAMHLSDSANIGDFEGYAVVFEISHPASKGMPEAVDGLIAFDLTDGCAYLSGTVALPLEDPGQQLEQFLNSLIIERAQLQ